MEIRIAATDAEIAACFPVMQELRPHLAEEDFVARVRRQAQAGYRLARVQTEEGIVAVAGFRIAESLSWGRFLYVDDLVTLPAFRSQGFGASLLSWLKQLARQEGCQQFHLDSGIQRTDAHRFYERENLAVVALHFVWRP